MFNYEYPVLPNYVQLIDLDLKYKMDYATPLYCRYIIWLKYRMNNQVITSALWQTKSFMLSDVVKCLPIVHKEAEAACKHYGMKFIKIRDVHRYSPIKIANGETTVYDGDKDEMLDWYSKLIWVREYDFSEREKSCYVVNDKNENYHIGFLWSWHDTLTGYRDFSTNPLTEDEKSLSEKYNLEVQSNYKKWEEEQKNKPTMANNVEINLPLLVYLSFRNYLTMFMMLIVMVFVMFFKLKL